MNGVINGVNVAEIQVRVSLGESVAPINSTRSERRSHNTIQALLGAAITGRSRTAVIREAIRVALHRGPYAHSREGMTPVWRDPPSAIPLASVLSSLLINPGSGARLAAKTIGNYSLGSVIDSLPGMDPNAVLGVPAPRGMPPS